jgi:hypothetical protein
VRSKYALKFEGKDDTVTIEDGADLELGALPKPLALKL